MTQVYDGDNRLIPVTVVEVGPCPVTQVKTGDSDGYAAVQIAYSPQKEQRVRAPMRGHFKKAGVEPHSLLTEFRCEGRDETFTVGDILTVNRFAEGQTVDVVGVTKGRGFQGVVKRYGFAGGPASHGSMFHRRGGSFGMCQWPGETLKGKKMPGRMGGTRRTVQNLQVVRIVEDKNLILVKGSLPGPNGSTVLVREAKKQKKAS